MVLPTAARRWKVLSARRSRRPPPLSRRRRARSGAASLPSSLSGNDELGIDLDTEILNGCANDDMMHAGAERWEHQEIAVAHRIGRRALRRSHEVVCGHGAPPEQRRLRTV